MMRPLAKLLSVVLLMAWIPQALATDVRGLVEATGYRSAIYPVADALVEFYRTRNPQRQPLASTYTRQNGMFYVKDVEQGIYFVRVNQSHWFRVRVENAHRQDLPRMRLP